jgi:nucleotide-binding universal stress UspA family protein
MYKSILIPTDGSELADKAVQHGIALSHDIGAKITVLTATVPFHILTTDPKMIEDTSGRECRESSGGRVRHGPRRARASLSGH